MSTLCLCDLGANDLRELACLSARPGSQPAPRPAPIVPPPALARASRHADARPRHRPLLTQRAGSVS